MIFEAVEMRRTDGFTSDETARSARSPESACVASVDRHRSLAKLSNNPEHALAAEGFFMSAYEARGNRIDRFRYMTKTPAYLQFRNSAVVLIDIVIASDCQYYFYAGSAKFPNPQIVCNLRV
ncbi:hypothetical protein [Paraburkholderia terrae]